MILFSFDVAFHSFVNFDRDFGKTETIVDVRLVADLLSSTLLVYVHKAACVARQQGGY